jgi:tetratricopeptide (TPR) repeat protein
VKSICLILISIIASCTISLAQSRIQVPKNPPYKPDTFKIDTASKRSGSGTKQNLDTSVDYDLEDLFNLDLTEAERAQAKAIIEVFTQQIKEDSTDVAAYINRGAYWSQLGLHVQAIKDYNEALAIDSNQPIVYYNRALSKARFFYTYDACLDLKRANDLGLQQAGNLLNTKCGRHKAKLEEDN